VTPFPTASRWKMRPHFGKSPGARSRSRHVQHTSGNEGRQSGTTGNNGEQRGTTWNNGGLTRLTGLIR
jgi:hypothetical protein